MEQVGIYLHVKKNNSETDGYGREKPEVRNLSKKLSYRIKRASAACISFRDNATLKSLALLFLFFFILYDVLVDCRSLLSNAYRPTKEVQ